MIYQVIFNIFNNIFFLEKIRKNYQGTVTKWREEKNMNNILKNGHILPTGQWYAPSADNNDALIMQEYARACQSMPEYARVCKSMPEYARICKSMSEYTRVC